MWGNIDIYNPPPPPPPPQLEDGAETIGLMPQGRYWWISIPGTWSECNTSEFCDTRL